MNLTDPEQDASKISSEVVEIWAKALLQTNTSSFKGHLMVNDFAQGLGTNDIGSVNGVHGEITNIHELIDIGPNYNRLLINIIFGKQF